jgi:U3 small nucleolar RNA-associated protein 10
MVVASTNADTNVRVVAVKGLLSSLSDTSLAETDKVIDFTLKTCVAR